MQLGTWGQLGLHISHEHHGFELKDTGCESWAMVRWDMFCCFAYVQPVRAAYANLRYQSCYSRNDSSGVMTHVPKFGIVGVKQWHQPSFGHLDRFRKRRMRLWQDKHKVHLHMGHFPMDRFWFLGSWLAIEQRNKTSEWRDNLAESLIAPFLKFLNCRTQSQQWRSSEKPFSDWWRKLRWFERGCSLTHRIYVWYIC